MATALPPVPDRLKAVAPYVKIAAEHDARDPVIAYWCRLYALQNGMKVDRSSSDCRVFLMAYMDWLEKLFTTEAILFQITNHRKYARWKAAYIHRCLKNGEQPIPGPLKGDDEGFEEDAGDGVSLQPDDFHKAQKYCKYAGSALQYEDVPTAIDNLQKALRLLTTGSEGL
ncbi:hypothetical protein IscW_ISCW021671 [Ixodes scapularis]|uniref:Uncharacterized protein n=1 Tax=Ixodes scapularis TaxID=6945 RepID=B7Q451_IXOSC|nr:hypothetical protein IscW_ISCW021671 [Ixodes scapularis]|eukprot:XP_002411475.1 hypothetical protein IscW_ISCW021671 [Ixodes scapularis]